MKRGEERGRWLEGWMVGWLSVEVKATLASREERGEVELGPEPH